MTRLSTTTTATLPSSIEASDYSRDQQSGVVHLGVGAFHRAHQAVYFDELMSAGERDWMITGASLRSDRASQQLNPQDGLFTLVVRDGDTQTTRLVRSIAEAITAGQQMDRLMDVLASSHTALVTLTITEKGYCLDSSTGELQLTHPDIAWDIQHPSQPRSAPGVLVAALGARRARSLPPFTILSCDNLSENGQKARVAILGLANAIDPELAGWIDEHGAFPSSMVDRIVPATTEDDIAQLSDRIGLRDEAMVKTEPFSQWVVEDWFCNRRPGLDKVGVQFTDDVLGWEHAKLRLLNGAHSALAYLGGLACIDFVHQAIADPALEACVQRLWSQTRATLRPVSGLDVDAYLDALRKRFGNSALQHRTRQIAMDGSAKLPQRLLDPIRKLRAEGQPYDALLFAVAAWIRWQAGIDDKGETYTVDDPHAGQTRKIVEACGDDRQKLARDMLGFEPVFGRDFSADDAIVAAVGNYLTDLFEHGALEAARRFADT